jgi:hypothetical protein
LGLPGSLVAWLGAKSPENTADGVEHVDSVAAKLGLSQDRDAKYYVLSNPQKTQ